MKKTSFKRVVKSINTTLSKRSPEILTGVGIAGMVTTTILAVKATPKVLRLIEEEKGKIFEEAKDEQEVELTKIEVIKIAWKPYIPAAVTCIFSVGCLIGAQSVNGRRIAAISTAYKLSETAFAEFKDKTVEVIGEKKVKDIKNKIAKDKVDNNPVSKKEVIITGKGTSLCMDEITGGYFESDIDTLRKIENKLNKRLIEEDYISLNDFYEEVGLHGNIGRDLGWRVCDGLIEFEFSSQIADDGRPCIVISYNIAPRYDFDKFA